MALTYKSPLSELLSSYTSSEQSLVAAHSLARFKNLEAVNNEHFSYAMSAKAQEKLISAGIYLSPFSGIPHSHPVCKTLENYILYTVLPGYIDSRFFFIGIKNSKFEFLKRRHQSLSLTTCINRLVTSKDRLRYPSDFVCLSSHQSSRIGRGLNGLDSPTLKELIPKSIQKGAKRFFLHDELHYWSKSDLCCFLETVKPEVLIGTLVFPPEVLGGSKVSLNQWCYEFEIWRGRLHFFPDGVRSEGYDQPLNGGFLLKTGRIKLCDGTTYCVDLLHSKFSHHLISITRGDALVDQRRYFGNFEAITTRDLAGVCGNIGSCYPISQNVVSKIYLYLQTLLKPDVNSAMAKLSQQIKEPTGAEIRFTREFSKFVIKTDSVSSLIMPETKKKMGAFLAGLLPKFAARTFSCYRELTLDGFIAELRPFTLAVDVMELKEGLIDEIQFYDFPDDIQLDEKLLESFEAQYFTGKALGLCDRLPNEYSMCHDRGVFRDFVEFRNGHLYHFLFKKLRQEFRDWSAPLSEYSCKERIAVILSACRFGKAFGLACYHSLHEKLRSRVIAVTRRGIRYLFRLSNPYKWFVEHSTRRYYTKYLEDSPSQCSIETQEAYRNVVLSIIGGGIKLLSSSDLGQTKSAGSVETLGIGDSYDTPGGEQQGVSVSSPENAPEALGICVGMARSSLEPLTCSCSCTLEMGGIAEIFLAEPIFPDSLHNRIAGWYSTDGSSYTYNGGKHSSQGWPIWISMLLEINGFGQYGFNCMLAQKYNVGASIGFHFDREDNLDGEAPILTMNICGTALFRVKGVGCEGAVRLSDASYILMPPGFQKHHKHAVSNTSGGRISLTFRKLADPKKPIVEEVTTEGSDTGAVTEQIKGLDCEICVLPATSTENFKEIPIIGDGNCFWHCVGFFLGVNGLELKKATSSVSAKIIESISKLQEQMTGDNYAETESIALCAATHNLEIKIFSRQLNCLNLFRPKQIDLSITLLHMGEHFSVLVPRNDCALRAVAECVGRPFEDIYRVLLRKENGPIFSEFEAGEGLGFNMIERLMALFGIRATVSWDDECFILNEGGQIHGHFRIADNHMEYVQKPSPVGVEELKVVRVEEYPRSAIKLLEASGTQIQYHAHRHRAEALANSFLESTTGVLQSKLFNNKDFLLRNSEEVGRSVSILTIMGTFGAGKSYLLKQFIRKVPGKSVTFVSPRRVLADSVREEIFGEKSAANSLGRQKHMRTSKFWKVFTFELFLNVAPNIQAGQIVIIDEVQLYPPGFLDLCVLLMDPQVKLVVTGDPCQSDYDSEKDRNVLAGIEGDVFKLLRNQAYKYNIHSRRFHNAMFHGRLPCRQATNDTNAEDEFYMISGFEEFENVDASYKKVFLVSSFVEKRIVRTRFPGGKVQILTFGQSTGMTFERGTIIITRTAENTSERRWVTALSRFAHNLVFLNLTGESFDVLNEVYEGRHLSRFLRRTADEGVTFDALPGDPIFTDSFIPKIGKDLGLKEEKTMGDPWLKCQLFLGQEADLEKSIEVLEECPEPIFKTHLARCEPEGIRSDWVHKFLLKEEREKWLKNCVTNQFTDQHSKNKGAILSNAAERFEAIYPRHRPNDTATFLMAVKKRLRFSKPNIEMAKFRSAMPFGENMLRLFLKFVPLSSRFDHRAMECATREFEQKKTSKSAATIENHAGRSCSDWLADVGLVFMKSQLCTKFDNRFRDAKAAQSIVCFQHSVLIRFAPYMRYIEKKLAEALPANFYIHSGKGLEVLNEWVKKYEFSGVCTESDYEAFDASQDQYIMAFEVEIMKHLMLPIDLINDYIYIKTHLGSKLGNFAIMRFSGEASTFLFNTMANMLFTFMRYEMTGKEAICFAGDDMCAAKRLRPTAEHEDFLSLLKLKAKVQFTPTPTFCGWNLCPDGIFKKPQLVYERMCIAREMNNLDACLDNYAIEVAFAYQMGEKAVSRMDEEELKSHYGCVRIIIRNFHKLKSDVAAVFTSAKAIIN